jgi:selenide,water dikinase
VGLGTSDDAAVYRVSGDKAAILTMDFFPPVVDDPYTFGSIAAANALSDVYAMGGRPVAAMNIVCFPTCLSVDVMRDILRGGADKVMEAGAVLAGGHSIEDDEPKYGLSVMGLVHPDRILTNAAARPGDVLILTKPLGTGILNTAIKADMVDDAGYTKAVETMAYLNADACEAALETGVAGCTDITGFGFLGHACEMADGSGVTLEIWPAQLPVIEESIELAKMGIIPAGAYNNQAFVEGRVRFEEGIKQEVIDIMFDPQTSGGLLISVTEDRADALMKLLKDKCKTPFGMIGRVKKRGKFSIEVKDNTPRYT